MYFYFNMFDLQRPIPVLNLFRHLQCKHGAQDTWSRYGFEFLRYRPQVVLDQAFVYWLMTVQGMPGIFCLFYCFCRYVVVLLTPGGAIPARRYTFSTDVGLRHTVMERHASFRAGSSLLTCVDLSHTGHAYSAVE